jgi:2,4-dienoyl-CoA reductase-like NADH-dependent reductase (Old Yellow Enzyme family)
MAENGMVTDREVELYKRLGSGDIGLIITHGIFPSRNGQAAEGQIGAHIDETIPSLQKLADAVHEGGGKIAAQLLHGGSFCREALTGSPALGPSKTISERTGEEVKEITEDEIYELIEDYGQAARRLIEADYDAIQLHGAHGWFLSAFLSPATNQRKDKWGGSAENRLRIVRMIYEKIREIAGPDFPVFIKLGLKDYHPKGKSLSEGLHTAKILQDVGMDAIEVSEGIEHEPAHHIRKDAIHPYYLDECREARQALSLPLILVGGMRYLKDMQAVLDENIADAVSMCRPFINDPEIVQKFMQGSTDHSDCISCRKCTDAMMTRRLRCVLNE